MDNQTALEQEHQEFERREEKFAQAYPAGFDRLFDEIAA